MNAKTTDIKPEPEYTGASKNNNFIVRGKFSKSLYLAIDTHEFNIQLIALDSFNENIFVKRSVVTNEEGYEFINNKTVLITV